MEDEKPLELEIETVWGDAIEEASRYQKMLERVVETETKVARSLRDTSKAAKEKSRIDASGVPSSSSYSSNTSGPYSRLSDAQNKLRNERDRQRAQRESGDAIDDATKNTNQNRLRDLEHKLRQAERSVDRAHKQDERDKPKDEYQERSKMFKQMIESSRINLPGGVNPLVGQTLKPFLGTEKAAVVTGALGEVMAGIATLGEAAGVAGLAIGAVAVGAYKLAEWTIQQAEEGARLTQSFSDLRASIGGSRTTTAETLMISRIAGVDGANAARSLQDRITSDPLAMATAGKYGVHNIKAPYGKLNFSEQYNKLIESVSEIQDEEQRRREAMILGVEQEVGRYSLLSGDMKDRLKITGGVTSKINNQQVEQRAAEFMSAMQNANQANENVKAAWGNLFTGTGTSLLNLYADVANDFANGLDDLGASLGLSGGSSSIASSSRDMSVGINLNTRAIQENTEAVQNMTGVLSNGPRGQGALPSALSQGDNFARGRSTMALAFGPLG
jgi:hypothetical protein